MKDFYTLSDLRRWQEVTGDVSPPIRLAVFGDPVIHSRSPQMHNAGLAERGINARYCRLHIKEDELEEALALLPKAGFIGANLTIPHKVAALKHIGKIAPAAQAIGAVNTVVVEADGSLSAQNTDGPGLVRAVQSELGAELGKLRVAVLGAGGGAGRAIAVQCRLEGCPRVVLLNRTLEKAQQVARELGAPAEAVPWTPDTIAGILEEVDLIINATSMGMKPGEPSVVPAEAMRPGLLVYDTIYTEDHTPLVAAALQAGARAANGLSMLLHQGARSFEVWFGGEAPVEAMRRGLTASKQA